MRHNLQNTVSQYLVDVIKTLKVQDVFGVPGDFSFSISDAICHDPSVNWVGCTNELNASYAADGYSRIHGMSVLSTTYGPGELSAVCGVAGAFSANLPMLFIVGMPSTKVMASDLLVHHTLGDRNFSAFYDMAKSITAEATILNADNAIEEIIRVVNIAINESKPVYIGVPEDVARMVIPETTVPVFNRILKTGDKAKTELFASMIAENINEAKNPIVLVGEHLKVYQAKDETLKFIESKNLPFTTMYADKAILDETHPNFIGLYSGKVANEKVSEMVESSDCVIILGALMTDFNTGGFSAKLPKNTITLMGDQLSYGEHNFKEHFALAEIISELNKMVEAKPAQTFIRYLGLANNSTASDNSKITTDVLYPRWQEFFKKDDIIITETGSITMGLNMTQLPAGAQYHNQTLWGSIGWATGAAFGAAMAAKDKRVILFTGEGSHQLTVQEITNFARFGVKPVVFVLNNHGYLIERLLCKEPEIEYNDIPQWNYTKLPEAFGMKDWLVERVETVKELDSVLEKAANATTGCYIEVVTDEMDAPQFMIEIAALVNKTRGYPAHLTDNK